jgi:hypothetical protein
MRRMRGMPRITPCPGRALAPGRDEMGTTRDAVFPGGRSHLSPGSSGEGGSRTRRDASHPPHALSSVPPPFRMPPLRSGCWPRRARTGCLLSDRQGV